MLLAAAAAQLFVGSRPEPGAHLQLQLSTLSTLSTLGLLNLDIETTFICGLNIQGCVRRVRALSLLKVSAHPTCDFTL